VTREAREASIIVGVAWMLATIAAAIAVRLKLRELRRGDWL
jgi:hypothetical protein